MAVALIALPTMAQSFSKPEQQVFQSTSTLTPSGSAYSANPTLNADGTAYSPASGPRKATKDVVTLPDIPVIQEDINPEALVPVGDAVLPLMLFACAYLAWNLFFRRKRA